MRAAHTLKSSSAAMEYNQISTLMHSMEDLFAQVQSQKKTLSKAKMQLLFECVDAVTEMIKNIKKGENESNTEALVAKLRDDSQEKAVSFFQ